MENILGQKVKYVWSSQIRRSLSGIMVLCRMSKNCFKTNINKWILWVGIVYWSTAVFIGEFENSHKHGSYRRFYVICSMFLGEP